jgi:hypothetical protein
MERITGPYRGRFIAAYTVISGDRFTGYAKICVTEPHSVWSEDGVEKLTSAVGLHSELEAVQAAERKARQEIAEMSAAPDPFGGFDTLH